MRIILLTFLFIAFELSYSYSDSLPVNGANLPPTIQNNEPATQPKIEMFTYSREFWLALSVLIFGCLTMLVEIYVIKTKNFKSDEIVKFVTITLIVTGSLFLICAGYSNDQIAPAFGLLGTIAGYVLGKNAKQDNDGNT